MPRRCALLTSSTALHTFQQHTSGGGQAAPENCSKRETWLANPRSRQLPAERRRRIMPWAQPWSRTRQGLASCLLEWGRPLQKCGSSLYHTLSWPDAQLVFSVCKTRARLGPVTQTMLQIQYILTSTRARSLHAVYTQSTRSLHAVYTQSARSLHKSTQIYTNLHKSTSLGGSQSRLNQITNNCSRSHLVLAVLLVRREPLTSGKEPEPST